MAYRKFGGDFEADRQFVEDTLKAANHGMIPASRFVFAERLGVSAEAFMDELNNGAGNDQELLDYIVELRKTYKTGLLTNASKGRMLEILGQAELDRCFDAVAESGSMGYAKPEPEAYEIIADRLGIRLENCLFTDDQPGYCEGARSVGMQAIVYRSFEQFKRDLAQVLQ